MNKVTLGGDRLGAGKKMQVELHGYERSNFDLGYIWRNTMATGTLVPFMNEIGLPGDTFDINLNANVLTLPTLGALFGSKKLQLDIFSVPIRLYNAKLHNNPVDVGLKMKDIKLPLFDIIAPNIIPSWKDRSIDTQQVHPSSVLAYLGTRSFGHTYGDNKFRRYINATPFLCLMDIFKNYYANKMEDNAYIIHSSKAEEAGTFVYVTIQAYNRNDLGRYVGNTLGCDLNTVNYDYIYNSVLDYDQFLTFTGINLDFNSLTIDGKYTPANLISQTFNNLPISTFFELVGGDSTFLHMKLKDNKGASGGIIENLSVLNVSNWNKKEISLLPFPLKNIDIMRDKILQKTGTDAFTIGNNAFDNDVTDLPPYTQIFNDYSEMYGTKLLSCSQPQEGLLVKTYQSDLFNNWLKDEMITGAGGIEEITSIDTSEGFFTLDTLNLAKKVYLMLNRVLVSGGTYQNWIEAVYDHKSYFNSEIPLYEGGMFQEIVFQEVVSTAATTGEPLGSLAGRGHNRTEQKGGKIVVNCNEPCYIIGIASITPRIDYSQHNDWKMELRSLDDLHKPQLDEIGFQDLLESRIVGVTGAGSVTGEIMSRVIGKQPAWIEYMTNINQCYGNFALNDNQMFMTLNRRYDVNYNDHTEAVTVDDITTYIDPTKYNHIFADASLDSMNYMVQIGVDIFARRKMSSKIIPNL